MSGSVNFRAKCLLSFLSMAFLVGIVGLSGIVSARRIQSALLLLVDRSAPRLHALLELKSETLELAEASQRFAATGSESSQAEGTPLADDKYVLLAYMEKLDRWTREYNRLSPPKARAGLTEFTRAKDLMIRDVLGLIEMQDKREQRGRIRAQRLAMTAAKDNLKEVIAGAVAAEAQAQEERRAETLSVVRAMMRLGIGVTLAALILSLAMALYLSRLVIRPVAQLLVAIKQIGHGDLSRRVTVTSSDELGQLSREFNEMADNLDANIEDRKSALLRMAQSEKLSAVGQLAAGVAHEINNPLGVILGFSQGMSRQIKPGDAFELPVKSIEREALRCKSLVQDLLTFARTSRSERGVMNINEAIKQTLALVQAQAKLTQVQLRVHLCKELPMILGNENQLEQVVLNLAKNAIDAMPNGGTLSITTELLEDTPHSWAGLKVSDTGVGIPPALMQKIFEPFFTTKPVGQGTGLGLSLIDEIVKKHSGTVGVESRPGATVFTVRFPVRTGGEMEERLKSMEIEKLVVGPADSYRKF